MAHAPYKLAFLGYWFFFAVLAIYAAQHPGYVRDPARIPFPWLGLFSTWIIVAFLVYVFYLILCPPFAYRSVARHLIALSVSFLLCVISVFTLATDMPGLYYIPHQFALLTFFMVLLVCMINVGRYFWRRIKNAP
jgi:hypothetical protein